MSSTYRRIVLASRPTGWVVPENFRLETLPIPSLGPNEVLVRNHYLSRGPYMRGRITRGSRMRSRRKSALIVSDHLELWPQGLTDLGALLGAGKLKFRETIAGNLARAPVAFIGLLRGKNFGKQIVKLV